MLKFTCPACHKSLRGPEDLAGKRVKCPACQQVIAVPEAEAVGHEPAHPPIPVPAAADLPTPPPSVEPPPAEDQPAPPPPSGPDVGGCVAGGPEAGPSERPPAPEPVVELQPAVESRTSYFAPAGYAASDLRGVPFKAPEFRRRLGHPAATRAATGPPPAGGASPPAFTPDPSREPAPADSEPEARP
jgi:hypothetical protein